MGEFDSTCTESGTKDTQMGLLMNLRECNTVSRVAQHKTQANKDNYSLSVVN